MSLMEASVYVHLDRYVALHIGDQTLRLPWQDMRARVVAHYHGERIVVGVRAEALAPVTSDTTGGDVIHGHVLYVEHHGHESLAFVDVGADGVSLDEKGGDAPSVGGGRLSRVVQVLRRGRDRPEENDPGQAQTATMLLEPRARHQRTRAEVAVRLQPYPSLRAGDRLSVAVRMDELHFFDTYGRRIDVGWV
jgi:multiple sugar transport system ATP-binding protein